MSYKQTIEEMNDMLQALVIDMESVELNRAAAQRVRVNSVKLAKIAKIFRKESIEASKGPSSLVVRKKIKQEAEKEKAKEKAKAFKEKLKIKKSQAAKKRVK